MTIVLCTIKCIIVFSFQWFSRAVSILITAIVAIPWFIIPCVLFIVLFLALRFYYIKTARELKRLEAIGKIIH